MKKPSYLHIICLLILGACETIVDIDIPLQERKLAIQSLFQPDSTWKAHVSHSNHILDVGNYENIANATVMLYENGQELGSLHWDNKYQDYTSDHIKPSQGKSYQVEVTAPGYAPVTAESSVPGRVPIKRLDIDTTNVIEHSEYERYYKIKLVFEDPEDQNFYEFDITSRRISRREFTYYDGIGYRDSVIVDTINYRVFLTPIDPAIESPSFGTGIILFDDIKFNGLEYTLEALINERDIKNTKFLYAKAVSIRLTCMLKNITEEKYLFEKSLAIQRSIEGDPFAEPMPVLNNIHNGFGIFAGYTQDVRVMEIK